MIWACSLSGPSWGAPCDTQSLIGKSRIEFATCASSNVSVRERTQRIAGCGRRRSRPASPAEDSSRAGSGVETRGGPFDVGTTRQI
jgi:hypothetical protein